VGYFDRDRVLMRTWHSRATSGQEDWPSASQIVIPVALGQEILRLAHDGSMAGHLGVNKTVSYVTISGLL
jgi:hypothetical protein